MDGLVVELALPGSVGRGDLVLGEVTVRNDGGSQLTVSSWLGLAEGDLWVRVRDPAGRDRTVHGRYQLDVLPQEVALGTGRAIARGMQLSVTSDPRTFDQPGMYVLHVVYAPGATLPPVESAAHQLVVEQAGGQHQRDAATLLDPSVIGDALALGHVDPGSPAAAALERVATDQPSRLAGALGRILLAASAARDGAQPAWDTVFGGLDPGLVARLVTAVQPPAGSRDDPLIRAALDDVTAKDAGPAGTRAAAMLTGTPFPARA